MLAQLSKKLGLFGNPAIETVNAGVNIFSDAYLVSTNSPAATFRTEDGAPAAALASGVQASSQLSASLWTPAGPRVVTMSNLSPAALAVLADGGVLAVVQNLPPDARFTVQVRGQMPAPQAYPPRTPSYRMPATSDTP